MEHRILGNFKEFGASNAPSIRDFLEEKPYAGQNEIAQFLRSEGTVGAVMAGSPVDFFTGKRIPGGCSLKTCGHYGWSSDLAYYVEKYNLRMPKDFEEFVLSLPKKDRLD